MPLPLKDEMVICVTPKDIDKSNGKIYPPLSELEAMGFSTNKFIALPFKFKNTFILLTSLLKEIIGDSNAGERLEICPELWSELKRLSQSIIYLTNSTSFRKGNKYFDFDKIEIDKKIGRTNAKK